MLDGMTGAIGQFHHFAFGADADADADQVAGCG
jgi:hypothetical protein